MKRGIKKFVTAIAVCAALLGATVMAKGATVTPTVKLSIGKADTITLAKPAADVLVANPGIADVGSLRSDRLYVVGRAIGDTNVLVFDDAGNQIADIAIMVRADQQTLRETVREFFPHESVDVRTVNDSIILQGFVSTPAVANQVRDLVGRFVRNAGQSIVDLMKVRGEQQVMLKVKVLEAQRTLLREYGINTSLDQTSTHRINGSFLTGGLGLSAPAEFGTGSLILGAAGGFGPLEVDIEGLERKGLVNTLAEPTLTAISGETAGFLAGGEFPVPATRDSSGNVTLEFRQFGVALNFIPTVLSNDRISLQLSSEVSDRSDAIGVTLGGITVPGVTIRRAQTTVQMGSGGTLMIAGLLQSNATNAMNGLPGISNLPIIGNLFKSKSFQRGESELVFLVTPYIVEPYADVQGERVAAASPLPSEIVTTSHGVSLSDVHSHTSSTIPASAAVPTPVPSATPAGVPMPVPGVNSVPLAPMPSRHSDASGPGDTQLAASERVDIIWESPKTVKPVVASAKKTTATVKAAQVSKPVAPATAKAVTPVKAIAPAPVKPAAPKEAAAPVAKPAEAKAPAVTPVKEVKPVAPKAPVTPVKAVTPAPAAVAPQKQAAAPVKPLDKQEGPKVAAVPVAPVSAAPLKKAAASTTTAKDAANPLAASFMNNLKNVYGNKAPSNMTAGPAVGYIVD